jgi:riboflavin kinase / FMN adenylyltransferase
MKIFRDLSNVPGKYKNAVITLGNFDGLHLGHRSIISKAKDIAKAGGYPLALMTFEPHPREFFASGSANEGIRIYNLRSKLEIIRSLGVECVFLMRFNSKLTSLSAHDFVKNILVDALAARHVITGENFYFGKNRGGNKELMAQEAKTLSFDYTACQQVSAANGDNISSSAIRKLLGQGDVKKVAAFLNRPYQINGRVKHGEGRGKTIGFPTANITLDKLFLPRYGVYAVCVQIEGHGQIYNAVANLGTKPTFGINTPLLEVHLLDVTENLYGKRICVEFIEFIRTEQKFSSLSELQSQIGKDVEKTREITSKL